MSEEQEPIEDDDVFPVEMEGIPERYGRRLSMAVAQRGVSGAMFEAASDDIARKVSVSEEPPATYPVLRRQSSRRVSVKRPVYTQNEFDNEYGAKQGEDIPVWREVAGVVGGEAKKAFPCLQEGKNACCSRKRCIHTMFCIFPSIPILWHYDLKEWLIHDIIAGITVGIMHIPQGMAYAMLATLAPVYGLYTSFFPTLVYCFFGTSRQISLGTIAIVSLLTGSLLDKAVRPENFLHSFPNSNGSHLGVPLNGTADGLHDDAMLQLLIVEKAKYASALACAVGLIQFLMGVLRCGFLTRYLSDPFISGYTIGAAVHVFTSQIKPALGVSAAKFSGAFNIPRTYFEIFRTLPTTNLVTLAITVISIILLVSFKEYINPRVGKYIKAPIPIELIIVIFGTLASYFLSLNAKYNVKIVGHIPRGLPIPEPPALHKVGSYVGDCFTVAIIAFSVCISLSKIFAKKHNYEVDANQELLAYGLSNFVSSFFLCYPAASSLSRSAVQDSMNGKTQLAGLISCCILLLVLLVIGPLFQSVPRCCLAAIILVALKGMFIHVKELPKLWHLSQWDSWTWIITALATIILDVDYGLVIGVAFSILSVIFRTQAPTSHLLGRIPKTDIYKNVDAYSTVEEVEGVKIFRYEGSVYYACCEHFRESIYTKTLYNPQKILIEIKSLQSKLAAWDERWKKRIKKDIPTSETRLTNIPDSQEMTVASTDPEKPYSTESYAINTEEYHLLIKRQKYEDRLRALTNIPIHHIIIDASTWGFIDHAAVLTLCQIFTEYELIDVTVFLANPKSDIREMLGRSDFQNDDCIYVTVHDAVMEALHEHKLSLVLNSASKRKLTRKKEAK